MTQQKSQVLLQSENTTFFNVIPSPMDERDWYAEPIFDEFKSVPSGLDWRKHLQRVRNQCIQGASLAFVGSCMVEWYARKIDKAPFLASPQFLYNIRPNKKTTLMHGRELMTILKDHGCCTEDSYPYGNGDVISSSLLQEAEKCKIDGYARIRTMETLKKALVVNGPCLICFPVFNHTTSLWKQRKGEEKLGCHAMAVIGYNAKGFIVRNSWGEHWDDNGYCLYPYSDWGCHNEIWTVVNKVNLQKFKIEVDSSVITNALNATKVSKKIAKFEKLTGGSGRDVVSSKKYIMDKHVNRDDLTYDNTFQDKGHSVSGSNQMKKSFVSKLFGMQSERPLPPEPVVVQEEKNPEPEPEPDPVPETVDEVAEAE
jgi:hypothetical protein